MLTIRETDQKGSREKAGSPAFKLWGQNKPRLLSKSFSQGLRPVKLNVPLPIKFFGWNPNPQCGQIRKGAFGRGLGLESRVLVMRSMPYVKILQRACVIPATGGRGPSPRTQPCWHSHLRLPASQPVRHKRLVFKTCRLCWSVSSAHPDYDSQTPRKHHKWPSGTQCADRMPVNVICQISTGCVRWGRPSSSHGREKIHCLQYTFALQGNSLFTSIYLQNLFMEKTFTWSTS